MITWKKGKREEMRKEERGKNTRHLRGSLHHQKFEHFTSNVYILAITNEIITSANTSGLH